MLIINAQAKLVSEDSFSTADNHKGFPKHLPPQPCEHISLSFMNKTGAKKDLLKP